MVTNVEKIVFLGGFILTLICGERDVFKEL